MATKLPPGFGSMHSYAPGATGNPGLRVAPPTATGNQTPKAAMIQYAMVQAGMITCGQVTGVLDNVTRSGNQQLANMAKKKNRNWYDHLEELSGFGRAQCQGTGSKRPSSSSGGGSRGGGSSGGGSGAGGGPTTSVSRQIRITDRETARSYLRSYLKDELGRMPTETEVDVFVGNLNGQEKVRPTVTTTTTSTAGSTQTSNSETVQGLNPSAYAEEYAEKKVDPAERGQYKTTEYYDVIRQMISGGG